MLLIKMPVSHRFIVCSLSIVAAYGAAALIGVGHPAAKLLHEWYPGVLGLFLIFLAILMSVVLRGGLEKSFWAIPLSSALCYPAATLAYIAYFSSFEPQRFANVITQVQPSTGTALGHFFDIVLLIVLFGPTVSLAWLFGLLAGVAFLLIARLEPKFRAS
jgi:hypothetical protein